VFTDREDEELEIECHVIFLHLQKGSCAVHTELDTTSGIGSKVVLLLLVDYKLPSF
jgi:hypothetical protein